MRTKRTFPYLLSVFIIILVLLYPVQALQGAKNGLNAFIQSVVPALFPFFVATSLFTKLGAATAFSKVLQPWMRPLFGLPGQSALPVFLSLVSGYPNGARATAALVEAKQLTLGQARRTMAFASTVGPSFVFSIIAASLLSSPSLAWLLFLPHLASAFLTGQIARICLPCEKGHSLSSTPVKAVEPMPINRCFISAVQESVTAILSIGGFIIFFFTFSNLLLAVGLLPLLAKALQPILMLLGYPEQLALPFLRGLFEMTDGCISLCATGYPAVSLLPLLCAIISFGGLCIQSQQALFLAPCGFRFSESLFFKTIQGVLAFALCSFAVRAIPTATVTTVTAMPTLSFTQHLLISTGTLGLSIIFLFVVCLALSAYTLAFEKRKKKTRG